MENFAINESQAMMIQMAINVSFNHFGNINAVDIDKEIGKGIISKSVKCLEDKKNVSSIMLIGVTDQEKHYLMKSLLFMRDHILSYLDRVKLTQTKQSTTVNQHESQLEIVSQLYHIFKPNGDSVLNGGTSEHDTIQSYSLTRDLFAFLVETTAHAKSYYNQSIGTSNTLLHSSECSELLDKLIGVKGQLRSGADPNVSLILTSKEKSTIHSFLEIFKSNISSRSSWVSDSGVSNYLDERLEKIKSIINALGMDDVKDISVDVTNNIDIDQYYCNIDLEKPELMMIYSMVASKIKNFDGYHKMLLSRNGGEESEKTKYVRRSLDMVMSLENKLRAKLPKEYIASTELDRIITES